MQRLTGITPADLEAQRIDVPRTWAEQWRATVVLKGAPTVTARPDGIVTVNPTGNPGLATAGTGDVLTGVVAGLIAQGVSPEDAASLGVYVHGAAADLLAERRGMRGMVASDVIEALPEALAVLDAGRDERG
jgi:hydroxyethylthiazole kinase-like uncharacterized protein yjeF